jgi:hypothetical protein
MEELKTILNSENQVTIWPAKGKKKEAVIAYMADKFEEDLFYSEAEVNNILNKFHTFDDAALLRRELYKIKYLDRDINGSKYWKVKHS